MFDRNALHSSLAGIGIQPRTDVFEELASAYGEPSRHYHTRAHVMECLTHLREYRELAQRPAEIEIALWFHDAVYDTSRTDNEERSAQWAERYLSSERAERAIVSRIATMIRATEKHDPRGADAELLVDIDLGILGAATTAFEAYDQGLRREYEWVPEDAYRETRHAFLHELLARETIYRTDTFRRKYEARARRNLSGKVRELEAAV